MFQAVASGSQMLVNFWYTAYISNHTESDIQEVAMRNKTTLLRFLEMLLLLLILYPLQASSAADKVSVQQILANRDTYNGKEVLLAGKATQIRLVFARKGNEYATFTLSDDSKKGIKIFVWGHPKMEEGQEVTVMGTYQKVRKTGRYLLYDEVEAKEIK